MYKVSKVKDGSVVQFVMLDAAERAKISEERDRRRYEYDNIMNRFDTTSKMLDQNGLFNPSPTDSQISDLLENNGVTTEAQQKDDITFSEDARRRFRSSLENFCSIFNAAAEHDPDMLKVKHEGKTYIRKPVFLTLTVPKQEKDDKEIKQKALNNLMQNLMKTYDVKCYIWKAEAQERGAIHFHVVIDRFVFHNKIRKLWYNTLKRLDCIPPSLTLYKATRLVHMKVVKDPAKLFDELAGYFDTARDENGKLIHKHDPSKRVRDINGRNWGCSDNLKYKNFMVYDICQEMEDNLYHQSLKTIEITGSNGNKVAELYITKYKLYNKQDKSFTVTQNKTYLQDAMLIYHLTKAKAIYNSPHGIDIYEEWLQKTEFFKLFSTL